MNLRFSSLALPSLLLGLAVFVWSSSSALPQVVASHFGAAGAADGYVPRGTYRVLMLVLIVILPLLVGLSFSVVPGRSGENLNIPHREYWLAPQRRESTVAFIRAHGLWFAAAVAIFMAYLHWLVLEANELRPPHLSTVGITSGMVVFFLLLAAWLAVLLARFRRDG